MVFCPLPVSWLLLRLSWSVCRNLELKEESFSEVRRLQVLKHQQRFFCICCLLASGVTAGHRPRRGFRLFVAFLSSTWADQEASKPSPFEASSRPPPSVDSSALNLGGLTRLSLSLLNIHQRLPHLTRRSRSELSKASPFCKLTLFFFLFFFCLTSLLRSLRCRLSERRARGA